MWDTALMKITKPTLILPLKILLLIGWTFLVYMLFKEQSSPLFILAVIIPALLAAGIIYLQRGKYPSKQLHDIAELARKVESHVNDGFDSIKINDAPEEIKPLITSINDLLSYFEDRYNQERDFTANASHELRTPLAGIRLQTEIAMKSQVPEQREKALKNIVKAVDRGTRLVEQLLTLSRLTADKIDLAMEAVSLGQVAAKTVGELIDIAEKKDIKLVMHDWDDCHIEASEDSIAIMVNNLIRNAITYCPTGSKVVVDVNCHKGKVELLVNDNGPGIPEDKYEYVLGRFNKAERGTKVGTGLGLAIVQRIAELHDASLELAPGQSGKGLKVSVMFEEYEVDDEGA